MVPSGAKPRIFLAPDGEPMCLPTGAGHRIMVQIKSTCFPLGDLNPQEFVPDIY